MSAKVKALQQWCKIQCEGYRDVNIVNMTSSWKNGLAFCAIIHRYRPDLIDYDSLSKQNVYDNNKLAFDVGASLGIPVLLDPEDMVSMSVPDRLCIITYVSQYYNYFHKYAPVGGPNVSMTVKRPSEGIHDEAPKRRAVEAAGGEAKMSTMQDKCAVCSRKVYLMERHLDHNKLYHRQCFRDEQKSADNAQSNGDHRNAASSAAVSHGTVGPAPATADHNGLSSSAAGGLPRVTPAPAAPEPAKMDVVREPPTTTSASSTSSNLMKSLYSTPAYQPNVNTNATPIKPFVSAADELPVVRDVPMSVSAVTPAVVATGNNRTTVPVSTCHVASVPVSTGHSASVPVSVGHVASVPVSTGHVGSVPVSTGHSASVPVSNGHSDSVPVSTGHVATVPVSTGHSASVPVSAGGNSASVPVSAGGNSASVPVSTGHVATVPVSAGGNSASVPVSAGGNSASVQVSAGGNKSCVPASTPQPVPRGILKVRITNTTVINDMSTTSHQQSSRLDQNSNSITGHETETQKQAAENSDRRRDVRFSEPEIQKTEQQSPKLDQNFNSLAGHETESKKQTAESSDRRRDVRFSEPETPKTEQPTKSNESSSVLAGLMHSLSAVRRNSSGSTTPTSNVPVSSSPTVVSPSAGTTSNVFSGSCDHRAELLPAAGPVTTPSPSVTVVVAPSSTASSEMPMRKAPVPTHHSQSLVVPGTQVVASVTPLTPVASPVTPVASPVGLVTPVTQVVSPSSLPSVAVVSPSSISGKERTSKLPEIRQTQTVEGLDRSGLSSGEMGHQSELTLKAQHKVPPSDDLHKSAAESRVPLSPVLHSTAAAADQPISHVVVPASVAAGVPSAVGRPDVSHSVPAHEYSPTTGRKVPTRPAPPSPVVIAKSTVADKTSPAIGRAVPFRAAPSPFSPSGVSPLPSTPSSGTPMSPVVTTPSLTVTVSSPSATPTTSNAHSALISPPVLLTDTQNVEIVLTPSDKLQNTSGDVKKSELELGDSEKVTLRPVPTPRQGVPSKPPRTSPHVEGEQSTNTNTSHPQSILKKTDQSLAPHTNGSEPCPKPRPRSPARTPSPRQPSPVLSDESLQLPKPKPRKPEKSTLDTEECKPGSPGIPDKTKTPVVSVSSASIASSAATAFVSSSTDVIMRHTEDRRTPVIPARPVSSTGTLPRVAPSRPTTMVETAQPATPGTAAVDVVPGDKTRVKIAGYDDECSHASSSTLSPGGSSALSPGRSSALSPGGSSDMPLPPQRFKKGQKRTAPPPPPSTTVPAAVSPPPPTVYTGAAPSASPRAAVSVAPPVPSSPRPVPSTSALAPPRPETAENARKKITPDVKFTFKNDDFRTSVVAPTPGGTLTKRAVPSRPAPPSPAVANIVKRQITAEERMPVDVIKERLSVLEEQLRVLERNGRTLEDRIRRHDDDVVFEDEDEIMMVEWFEMVNKKNELVREESELIYKLKQQDLEDQHSQVEYELRRLMAIPDHAKTETDKAREAYFIQQLIVTVHRRNNIVDSIEQDRLRYIQEDEEISHMMSTKSTTKSKSTKAMDRKKKTVR